MIPDQRDPPTNPFRITWGLRGYTYRVCLHAPSDKGTRLSLGTQQPPLRARGLTRALGSQSTIRPSPALGSYPAYDASQGPGVRRCASSRQGSRAPGRRTLGAALPAAPTTRSRTRRDVRRQVFPSLQGLGAPGPVRQPLEPITFGTRKTPEGPPRRG
jgi:hypothetical protein